MLSSPPPLHRVLVTTAVNRGSLSFRRIALDFVDGLPLFWPNLETRGSDTFFVRDKCNVMVQNWKHAQTRTHTK